MFFNEKMNRFTLDRKGYHDMRDVAANVDMEYATGIAKAAIATAERLAR